MSSTHDRQNAAPQQVLTTLSVGVSSQISHKVEPFATAGPLCDKARSALAAWAFLEWTILNQKDVSERMKSAN
jgi:hypothetical protein